MKVTTSLCCCSVPGYCQLYQPHLVAAFFNVHRYLIKALSPTASVSPLTAYLHAYASSSSWTIDAHEHNLHKWLVAFENVARLRVQQAADALSQEQTRTGCTREQAWARCGTVLAQAGAVWIHFYDVLLKCHPDYDLGTYTSVRCSYIPVLD